MAVLEFQTPVSLLCTLKFDYFNSRVVYPEIMFEWQIGIIFCLLKHFCDEICQLCVFQLLWLKILKIIVAIRLLRLKGDNGLVVQNREALGSDSTGTRLCLCA